MGILLAGGIVYAVQVDHTDNVTINAPGDWQNIRFGTPKWPGSAGGAINEIFTIDNQNNDGALMVIGAPQVKVKSIVGWSPPVYAGRLHMNVDGSGEVVIILGPQARDS